MVEKVYALEKPYEIINVLKVGDDNNEHKSKSL